MTQRKSSIKIGGASGYWGESAISTPQLLKVEGLDYIVYDYLAEITMSIMARARASDAEKGYALDFVSAVLKINLTDIAEKGVKILSNAGGVNPIACGEAVRTLVDELGLDLDVAVITGDDLMAKADTIAASSPKEMFSNEAFPELEKIASMNAYLGAGPILAALDRGADIIITGRCADSALTLAACQHAFGWTGTDYDLLAAGSLAGHLLECGPQATGGNFTDWRDIKDIDNIGYPIAEIEIGGEMVITKPEGTGGLASRATVAEQLVYEIEDPEQYLLPDVICDFSSVTIEDITKNRVIVSGAKGRAPTGFYKVSTTFLDGFKAGSLLNFVGFDAADKARAFAKATFLRAEKSLSLSNLGPFQEKSVEIIGDDSQFPQAGSTSSREVVLKIAVRHSRPEGAGLFLKEIAGIGLATPAGLTVFNAGRPKPSPVVRLFSFLIEKDQINPVLHFNTEVSEYNEEIVPSFASEPGKAATPQAPNLEMDFEVQLMDLAYARSGDKGNKANIGVIARDPVYIPYIWQALDENAVASHFVHFQPSKVDRFYMPGIEAVNLVLHDVLGGGGVASLRADAQGKAYSQILLHMPVRVPGSIAKKIRQER